MSFFGDLLVGALKRNNEYKDNETKAKAFEEADRMARQMMGERKKELANMYGFQSPETSEAYNLVKQLQQAKSSYGKDPNAVQNANSLRDRFAQLGFSPEMFTQLGFNPEQDIIGDDNAIKNTIKQVYLNNLLGRSEGYGFGNKTLLPMQNGLNSGYKFNRMQMINDYLNKTNPNLNPQFNFSNRLYDARPTQNNRLNQLLGEVVLNGKPNS
jgi:hypothetical protein